MCARGAKIGTAATTRTGFSEYVEVTPAQLLDECVEGKGMAGARLSLARRRYVRPPQSGSLVEVGGTLCCDADDVARRLPGKKSAPPGLGLKLSYRAAIDKRPLKRHGPLAFTLSGRQKMAVPERS